MIKQVGQIDLSGRHVLITGAARVSGPDIAASADLIDQFLEARDGSYSL
jgi:hypothetical protein